jgi:gentisate 1,2-dioxygenase
MNDDASALFLDRSGARPADLDLWDPIVISREQIEDQVERLTVAHAPSNGRRSVLIVHPRAEEPGLGLAPGIRVSLDVLLPGERTTPFRHNASEVSFCIQGGGTAVLDGREVPFERHDVLYHPSMVTYSHANDTDQIQVRLTYSNAALLEKMHIHVEEEDPTADRVDAMGAEPEPDEEAQPHPAIRDVFQLTPEGAHLMSYERLVNPPSVEQKPIHWPWADVKAELDKLGALGPEYKGRRLYLLYNPATGRANGTTNNFFATMTIRPANIIDRPHRHSSAAINYYFAGSGSSVVGGKTYHWKAGDLMLSAPGWMVHHHRSGPDPVYELTVQDQPLNIAMDSLLWQEDLKKPFRLLGSQPGFQTNRGALDPG